MRLRLLVLLVLAGSVTAAFLPGRAVHAGRSVASEPAISRDSTPVRITAEFLPDFTEGIGLYVFDDIYSDPCTIFGSSTPNWGNCRNQDEALDNDTNAIVRIYYSPDYKGAWACLPIWEDYSDLNHSDQTFNDGQGKPGYGQEVWKNVASSAFGTGTCEKSLPGGKAYPPS